MNKINPKNIFFINLENPYLDEFRDKVVYLEKIFEEYISLSEARGRVFTFLDEVQFFNNWQVFVKSKYEREGVKFFLAGSNSWLLSSEYVTLLSGRTINFELFPFSFREFCRAKGIDVGAKINIFANERKVKSLFKEYIRWGGFPEIVLDDSEEHKKEIIFNYYNNIIFCDIIPRFKIVNTRQTQELARYLLSNIGKLFSYNKLGNLVSLSDKTVKEYIHYFSQSYLMFEVAKYDDSVKKQLLNLKKIYVGDIGFTNILGFRTSEDKGRLLENLVFLDLKRLRKEVYYHHKKKECDFVVRKGRKIVEAIQVCWELNTGNREREIKGLLDALSSYKLKTGLIITENQEEEFVREGFKVKVLPFWKWTLMSSRF